VGFDDEGWDEQAENRMVSMARIVRIDKNRLFFFIVLINNLLSIFGLIKGYKNY